MALSGLFPMTDEGQTSSKYNYREYPKLKDMLDYICKQQPKFLDSTEIREEKLLFPSKMFVAMINFLLKSFEADVKQNASEGAFGLQSSVVTMCLLLEHAMAFEGSAELHTTAAKGIIAIGTHFPEVNLLFLYVLLSKFLLLVSVSHLCSFFPVDSITLCRADNMVKATIGSCGL